MRTHGMTLGEMHEALELALSLSSFFIVPRACDEVQATHAFKVRHCDEDHVDIFVPFEVIEDGQSAVKFCEKKLREAKEAEKNMNTLRQARFDAFETVDEDALKQGPAVLAEFRDMVRESTANLCRDFAERHPGIPFTIETKVEGKKFLVTAKEIRE